VEGIVATVCGRAPFVARRWSLAAVAVVMFLGFAGGAHAAAVWTPVTSVPAIAGTDPFIIDLDAKNILVTDQDQFFPSDLRIVDRASGQVTTVPISPISEPQAAYLVPDGVVTENFFGPVDIQEWRHGVLSDFGPGVG
jgi:hypothetical protein